MQERGKRRELKILEDSSQYEIPKVKDDIKEAFGFTDEEWEEILSSNKFELKKESKDEI